MPTARAALARHPLAYVKSLYDLENVLGLRVRFGGPREKVVGHDCIGFLNWEVSLYTSGASPCEALDFINFILKYKLEEGALQNMPKLCVQPVGLFAGLPSLPRPWEEAATPIQPLPNPFCVQPPLGWRHVVVQLQRSALDGQSGDYFFVVFGGTEPFEFRFEDCGVPSKDCCWEEEGEQKSERVWYVRFNPSRNYSGPLHVLEKILVTCLGGIPVFFINELPEDDAIVQWLLRQPSVQQGDAINISRI